MKNNKKQAVVLNNFTSPYIYQAILILKDYDPALDDKIIEEAEEIVSKYLNNPQSKIKKQKKLPWFLLGGAVFGILVAVLSYIN